MGFTHCESDSLARINAFNTRNGLKKTYTFAVNIEKVAVLTLSSNFIPLITGTLIVLHKKLPFFH